MDINSVLKALENSPKGQLKYETGWDELPNAITNLITVVQEKEIDKPNRQIVERAFTSFYYEKDRSSFSPRKTSPTTRVTATRGRHSLPAAGSNSKSMKESSAVSPTLLSSFLNLKVEESQRPQQRSVLSARRNVVLQSEPRIEVQEVLDDANSSDHGGRRHYRRLGLGVDRLEARLLTPPTRMFLRKKSYDGSPIFKPSPSFSSSPQTQTHSSATSDATTASPTRNPTYNRKSGKYGIHDEALHENEDKLEEDLMRESRIPFNFIEKIIKYEDEEETRVNAVMQSRILKYQEFIKECERKIKEADAEALASKHREEESLKQSWIQRQQANLLELQSLRMSRQKQEDRLTQERKAAATIAEASRKAALEAAKQEQIRIQKVTDDERRRMEEASIERERIVQQKAAEEKRLSDELAAAESRKRENDQKKAQEVVPQLAGLILKDDLSKYAKTTDFLKTFDEPAAHIDGKDPASKAFYIGAVKCINTPLNALADTNESEIMSKVQHFSKLLNGEPVSGGGSMTTMFSCSSVPNGNLFVMKTLAFRFVKKAEADVTRGKSTVQPLATVGTHLCKKFPMWASLVQAYLYKLCPFLVPFSHPQGDKSIHEYARELGHELSGTETAVTQTFLDRIKGYCTLYALMITKFQSDGPLEVGDATTFFTFGGAWHILSTTMKLEPQVDVTATVIHTLLDILDDKLHAIYKNQFTKLMRILILNYLPKIKNITPPAKSGSVSRLQIYLEKKFAF